MNIIKDKPTTEAVNDVLVQLSAFTTIQTDDNSKYSGELEAATSTLEVIASIDYSEIAITEIQTTVNLIITEKNLLHV